MNPEELTREELIALVRCLLATRNVSAPPDWKDAPDWTRYRAQNRDGEWVWYSTEPEPGDSMWLIVIASVSESAMQPNPDWRNTLEAAPWVKEARP